MWLLIFKLHIEVSAGPAQEAVEILKPDNKSKLLISVKSQSLLKNRRFVSLNTQFWNAITLWDWKLNKINWRFLSNVETQLKVNNTLFVCFLHFGWFFTSILQDFDKNKKLRFQPAWRSKTGKKSYCIFFSQKFKF